MKDEKAAKRIIKRAKKHPQWYTNEDVLYAKIVRKRIKREEKQHEREISISLAAFLSFILTVIRFEI